MAKKSECTVARYLITRLSQMNVKHIFGVPGDYVLDFMDRILASPLALVGNCNELNAGYAADGYARTAGAGAVAVTYCVGGFSMLNAIAGAYAEQVPVVAISGAPASARRSANTMVHHMTKNYYLQKDIYAHVTVDSVLLTDPAAAPAEIDRVLCACLAHRRPVYIEIPVDMVDAPAPDPGPFPRGLGRSSDPAALYECVAEAAEMINQAKHPVVLAGIEVARFGLSGPMLSLVEKAELPYATTLTSKSVLPELHPQCMGVYQGALSDPSLRAQVEGSDAILSAGVWLTDIDTGGFTARLPQQAMITVNSEQVRIGHHFYHNVWMGDFLSELAHKISPRDFRESRPRKSYLPKRSFIADPGADITIKRFYERLSVFLDDDMILVSDTGDALCAVPSIYIEEPERCIVQGYYMSIGYAVPACLGVSLAAPEKRPVVLVGDGAFQMTAQELSTLLRHGCSPVIFLLNNDGLVIERLIHDGPYNEIQPWKYYKLPEVFGDGAICREARTEGDLEEALAAAQANRERLCFIEVHLDRWDSSEALKRLGVEIRKLST
ncbi:MAG: thiamine pyrophosphate-binding protein [Thermodesulfobacteriota bacterium]